MPRQVFLFILKSMKHTQKTAIYRTSVKALILDKNKKFLLAKEDSGKWELLGGGLDFGENPQQGLKREIQEETGIQATFIAENPSYFLTWEEKELWRSNIIYYTEIKDLNFIPSKECTELRFFSKKEALQENLYQNVKKFLEIYNTNNH